MLYSLKRAYKKSIQTSQVEKPGFFDVYFVAKKKIFKRAVDRNKAKRRARHAYTQAFKELLTQTPSPLAIKDKKQTQSIIFFLERDMIQESYINIVEVFKKDILSLYK